MSEPKSREGTMFGPYRLLRLIGKGGMGEVYEAEDTVKDRIVAVKLLPDSVSHDPVFRKRLQREAHSAGRLQEPHVVPIHDYGEIDGVLYVDMRMITGSDLRKLLRSYGPMTPARGVAIVRQVASALDAAHEGGIMHRDVKPENILVTREDFAYLVDFGIANAVTDEKLTEMGTAVGTYAYMAPERFQSGEVTYRADIYALACVLHECLTGSQPYSGDSVSVVITGHLMQPIPRPSVERPGIPAGFDQVIARGMAKKPEERYASAVDMAMAATQALTEVDKGQAETIVRRSDSPPTMPVDQGATLAAPMPPPGYPPSGPTPPPTPYGVTPPPFATTTPPPQPPAQQYGFSGPPRPGPNPKSGKKVPWIPIAAIGGVLLLVAAAIGIVVTFSSGDDNKASGPGASSRTPTKSSERTTSRTKATSSERPTSTNDPSSFTSKLMALIPPGYPQSVCDVVSPPAPGALATVDCQKSEQPGGPDVARYSLFASQDDLQKHFDGGQKQNDRMMACPGADSDAPQEWTANAAPDKVAGQVVCGVYQGNADIMWSHNSNLMLADVQSADLEGLYKWWTDYS
jgi:serine/threonine protein kinase